MSGEMGAALAAKTSVSGSESDPNLPGFRRVGHSGYLYEPSVKDVPSAAPELIILCTWMDAAVKHLAKYAKAYTTQFPDSTLLVIRSDVSELTWRRKSSQLQRMQSIADVVKEWVAQRDTSTRPPRVLLHVFSNGGAWQACILAEAYRRIQDERAILPVSAFIIDSSPSLLHPRRAHVAMMTGLPKSPVIRIIGTVFFWFVIAMFWICGTFKIQENPLITMRAALNNPSGPFMGNDKPRVYIFSETDKLVPAEDIILHASDARSKLSKQGVDKVEGKIRLEEFTGSNHVSHMIVDPKRYWKIIEDTWKQALTWN